MEISLGICGSAGRKDDAKKMSKHLFEAGCIVASGLIDQLKESNYEITHLISGGAAFIDFIAVKLFLDKKVPYLRLFIPCEWDDGIFKSKIDQDTGSILNYYHKKFQTITNINSLSQMQIAKMEGAEFIVVEKGFYARNYLIAKSSDFILAMTFGEGSQVKQGGTAHCVRCYLDKIKKKGGFDKSFHYNLSNGQIYVGCTAPPEVENINKFKHRNLPSKILLP